MKRMIHRSTDTTVQRCCRARFLFVGARIEPVLNRERKNFLPINMVLHFNNRPILKYTVEVGRYCRGKTTLVHEKRENYFRGQFNKTFSVTTVIRR